MFEFLSLNIEQLALYLFDANKRIYWLYLASAIFLAIPVYLKVASEQKSGKSLFGFFSYLVPKRIYFSKSAQHDYLLFLLNKLIKASLFPAIILTMAPIALGVTTGIENLFGTMEHLQWSSATIVGVFTLLLFVFDDLTRFLLHLALHKIPVLWEFHKVHHSAKVLTPMTIYRSHPVESYLYACRMALTQGFVVGLCYYFFGPTLKMYDIVGANLFVFLFNFMGSNLRHSHIWLSWGDKVENWFISPAQHQVHHSDQPKWFDVNLGSALAIWDRMAGTLVKASQVQNLSIGIGKEYAKHDSLLGIYWSPFVGAGKVLFKVLGPKPKSEAIDKTTDKT